MRLDGFSLVIETTEGITEFCFLFHLLITLSAIRIIPLIFISRELKRKGVLFFFNSFANLNLRF